MHAGYFKLPKEENICQDISLVKRPRWQSLSQDDKIDIIHDVLIQKKFPADVAKKYHRTAPVVNELVRKVRNNPNLLREMIDKRD